MHCRNLNSKEKLSQYFLESCASYPLSIAIITGTHRLSYQQLLKAAKQVQSILKDAGVKQSQVVAICIPRSTDLVAAILGCVLHGAVFLLLNPSLPTQRMQVLLEISRPCAVLYSTQDHPTIELVLNARKSVIGIGIHMEGDCIIISPGFKVDQSIVESFTCGDDVLYIIFTSGSTGIPKAVCASASGTLNRFEWMWKDFPFQSNDVVCFKTSVNFIDYIWEILGTLLKGAPLAIPLEEESKDPRLLAAFMKEWKVTRVMLVPAFLRHILEFTSASESLQYLTLFMSTGEPLSLSIAAMFLKVLPSCRFLNVYGTSEISGDVTFFEVTHQYVEKTSSSFVPLGKPIPNVYIEVIDPLTGEVIPQNSSKPGELVTYGVCVAYSYLNSDDKSLVHTSDKSTFNTHDLVHYNSSGDLMYIGRRDHQVKVRGVRINPSEIEAMLEKNSIIERVVVAADESHMNLMSFIQISESLYSGKDSSVLFKYGGASFFTNAFLGGNIATELLKLLPQYLVPSLYFFTHRLPTLPSGKVNRKELPPLSEIRTLLSEPTNEIEQLSKTEEQLCCLIRNILQLSTVSLMGNFFALGGNSLSAVELASGIEELFHCKLSVSTIISSPTIQSLAVAIDSEVTRKGTVLSCSHDHLELHTGPLTLGQEHIFAAESIAGRDVYEIGVAAKCLQQISIEHLSNSVRYLAVSHESLRTLFSCAQYGIPFQKVLSPDSTEYLSLIKLGCNLVDCSKECQLKFIDGQISLPKLQFNLSKGPLWKFTLFTNVTVPGEIELCSIFAFQAHHIMTDGWSMQQLLRDLEDTYVKYVKGTNNEIVPHHSAKLSYAIQQAIQQRSISYDNQLKFWQTNLKDASLPLFLHPKCIPSYTANHSSHSIHSIFKTLRSEISSFCQANSITEFIFALTGLLVALYALNDVQDFVTVVPYSSRNSENMKISGLFDNCLPLRTLISSTTNLHILLLSIKECVLNMIEHQIPSSVFEQLNRKGIIQPNHPFFSGMLEQLLFVYDYEYSAAFTNSVLFENVSTHHPTTDYYMELYVTASMDNFEVQVVYSDQLYDASTVTTLLNTWERVTETMIKHVYLYVPLKLLCQDLHIPSHKEVCEEQPLGWEDYSLQYLMGQVGSNEDSTVISLNCNESITQQQLSSVYQSLCNVINAYHSGSHPMVITNLSLSAFVIALMTSLTKLNCGFSYFSSVTGIVENLKETAGNTTSALVIVVRDMEEQECILKSLPPKILCRESILTMQSLLDPHPGVMDTASHGSVDHTPEFGKDVMVMKSNWQSDVKVCSHLTTKYFSGVRGAVVLMSHEASTLPIATSLLLHGIRVEAFTYECLDVFIQFISNSGADLLVIPEITVRLILPKIVGCNNIKHLWIQGLPLGLAYISKWMTASQHVQVIVTHSLVHEQHLITHHLNLKDIPSIEDGSIPCIPIGSMCHGLNGKVLHRDGRDVCQGFVGSFATMDDGQIHRSTSLVRQLPKDGSYELVSVDAEAYYKGIDVTPALFVLSTIPEVTWCGVSTSTAKDSTIVLYTTNVNSSRNEIRERLLDCLSLSYLSIIYPLAVNPPITPDFKPNLGGLSFAKQDSLLGPSMFAAHKDDEDVDKVVKAVSKAFGTDPETVWQTSDLLAVGGMSSVNILALTINLNTEFEFGYSISEVYQAVRNGCLIELVRGKGLKQ